MIDLRRTNHTLEDNVVLETFMSMVSDFEVRTDHDPMTTCKTTDTSSFHVGFCVVLHSHLVQIFIVILFSLFFMFSLIFLLLSLLPSHFVLVLLLVLRTIVLNACIFLSILSPKQKVRMKSKR